MAILKFRVYWAEDDSVYRDVAIKPTQTFFDLHLTILQSFEFDTKHAATFYRSNDNWDEGREITLEKYDKSYRAEPLLMTETLIGGEVNKPSQKFLYLYDFVKSWSFMIELIGINKEEERKATYPFCVRKEGIAPPQYGTKGLVDNKLADIEEKYDLTSDALDDGFSEEDEDGNAIGGEEGGDEFAEE